MRRAPDARGSQPRTPSACHMRPVTAITARCTVHCSCTIKDFKKLNAAKFHVLNDIIAPHIVFDYKGTKYNVVSSNPFQKEWDMLKSTGALQARPRYNIRALESSNIEYFVPQAFIAVFCLFFLTAILPIVLHLNFFLVAWKNLMRL